MIRKSILLFSFVVLACRQMVSQNIMHSIGANISVLYAKINTAYEQETFVMQVTQFSYSPRFIISGSENSSLSVGSPLGAGIGILTSGGDADGVAWSVDVPLVLDYNIGCKSSPANDDSFGSYFGLGFGYMYAGWSSLETDKAVSYGPLARAGIRLTNSERTWHMTTGLFFKYGLEKEKYKTFGFNVLYDF